MWIPARSSLVFLALALLAVPARGATLTVLAPASAQPGLKALAADYTAKTGAVVTVGGGSRANVLAALKAGPADVVVLPTNDLITINTVSGMTPLGNIAVGVGVKAGSKAPDVSTPEKFRAVLLKARGVAFADPAAGTSAGQVIANMLGTPGFRAVKRVPVQGLAATALADGRADVALQLAPELANNKAVALAGPVPDMYGAAVDFSVGIAAVTNNAVAARDFITFITDPANAKLWRANGLIPLFY
ncbi:MAG TPA: substrate-binding domain-containing protein [Rhizomicrobium sp.]|nr:substrate-binding domain-containing protein [Rhizomicrobium sp.]